MRTCKLALLASLSTLMAGVASAAAHSIEGTMRKLAEKDLLLQTGANMVLHLRLLALTQFRDRHGEPLRDSLLRPGDEPLAGFCAQLCYIEIVASDSYCR